MRKVTHTYQDPLELVWIEAAARLGVLVQRDPTVFASWDGSGVLRIGVAESLDADDSLAQVILHELCHALVEGPDAFCVPDWGLDVDRPEHVVHEHACLRLQAAFADTCGLRTFFASTTDFRDYYDNLPENPLADTDNAAARLAIAGWHRSRNEPWCHPLQKALAATKRIAAVVGAVAPAESLWSVAT
jgi:hypothetical protein